MIFLSKNKKSKETKNKVYKTLITKAQVARFQSVPAQIVTDCLLQGGNLQMLSISLKSIFKQLQFLSLG